MSDDLRDRLNEAPVSYDVDAAWARFTEERADALPTGPAPLSPGTPAAPAATRWRSGRVLPLLLTLLLVGGAGAWLHFRMSPAETARDGERASARVTTGIPAAPREAAPPFPSGTAARPDGPSDARAAVATAPSASASVVAAAATTARPVGETTARTAGGAVAGGGRVSTAVQAKWPGGERLAFATELRGGRTDAPAADAADAYTTAAHGRSARAITSGDAPVDAAEAAEAAERTAPLSSLASADIDLLRESPSLALPWDFPPYVPSNASRAAKLWVLESSAGASYLDASAPADAYGPGDVSPLARAEAGLLLRRDLGRGGWWAGLAADASRHDERYRYAASTRATERHYHEAARRIDGRPVGDTVSVGVTRARRVDHVNHTTALDVGLLLGYNFPAARAPVRLGVFGGAHYRLLQAWRGRSDASAAERAADALAVSTAQPYVGVGRLRFTGGLRVGVPLVHGLSTGLELRGQWGRGATYADPDGGVMRGGGWGLGARLRLGYRFQ